MSQRDTRGDVLRFVAEGVTALAGFDVVAISIVDGDELYMVAVAGSEDASRELLHVRAPVSDVLAELDVADEWGRMLFVPHDRAGGHLKGFEWIPDVQPEDGPDAWHPEDLLCALLRDESGQLRGVLSVDLPRNGRRPDAAQRQVLDLYATQAERAVVSFVEHDEFAQELEVERRFSEYRGHLIDVISHEVRTPTTSILGHAQLALEQDPDPRVRRHLEAIVRGGERIADMAESLLLMSSAESPDGPSPTAPVDLAVVARDAREAQLEHATSRDIAIEVSLPDGPVEIEGVAEELGIAVRNLLSNAVKYSEPGQQVRLSVEARTHDVAVVVSDDGIGISAEDQKRLFEEFYRAPSTAVRSAPGTGLGLAIVDRIVRRHDGHVEVGSTLGEGTTMRIVLPFSDGSGS